MLLSAFVIGTILYVYLLAAGTALFGLSGLVSQRDTLAAVHHSKVASDGDSTSIGLDSHRDWPN